MQRVVNAIEGSSRVSMRTSASLQTDWVNLHAAHWLPVFRSALRDQPPEGGWNEAEEELISRLRRWEQAPEYTRGSSEALLFAHWYFRLMDETLGTKLSGELYGEVLETGYIAYNATDTILTTEDSFWIDGSRDALLATTFRETVNDLKQRFGEDISAWRWDDVQSIELSHTLSEVPGLGLLLNRGPYPYGGDHMTVGRAAYDLRDPFNVKVGAGVRMVVSLEPEPHSLVAHAGGQSGHAGHRWYADQFDAWREGRTRHVPPRSERHAGLVGESDRDAQAGTGGEESRRRTGTSRLRLVPESGPAD